jgi:hypothetical protein
VALPDKNICVKIQDDSPESGIKSTTMSLTISNYRELINMMFYLGTSTYKITRFKNPLLLILLLLTLYLTLQKSTKVVDLIPLSGESSCIFTQIFLSGKATRLSKLLAYLSEVTEVYFTHAY